MQFLRIETRCHNVGFTSNFSFPDRERSPERHWKWITESRRVEDTPSIHSLVCSVHFPSEYIDRTGQIVRLREGAVPTNCQMPALPEVLYWHRFIGYAQMYIGYFFNKHKQILKSIKLFSTCTGRVPKFGRFWRYSSIFSIIYKHICIKGLGSFNIAIWLNIE